jgi:hypothetical protein
MSFALIMDLHSIRAALKLEINSNKYLKKV